MFRLNTEILCTTRNKGFTRAAEQLQSQLLPPRATSFNRMYSLNANSFFPKNKSPESSAYRQKNAVVCDEVSHQ